MYSHVAMNTIPTQANPAKDEHCTTTTITNASSRMILKSPFSIELVTDDEKLVHFYTGFEDYHTLTTSYIFWDHLYRGHLQYWMERQWNGSKGRKHTVHLVYYHLKMSSFLFFVGYVSLVPRPFTHFSMLHAEKREGLYAKSRDGERRGEKVHGALQVRGQPILERYSSQSTRGTTISLIYE